MDTPNYLSSHSRFSGTELNFPKKVSMLIFPPQWLEIGSDFFFILLTNSIIFSVLLGFCLFGY
jgi:hypothetical protein